LKNLALPQAHRIGKINLAISTSTFESALQLRARAEDIAWKRIPNIIEEVFVALAPAELHVRIDRLDLDLGNITEDALEKELPATFERALRESLADAIAKALHAPSDRARALSPSMALLEEFDAYLVNGTVPFLRVASTFDSTEIIQRLIAEQPAALAQMLRRRARDKYAIERLVLQSGEENLRTLLGMLAPADAAVIVAYLADFRRTHAQVKEVQLSEPALRRSLWILTLQYLLRDAGTQFNRRAYLASLIESVASAEGMSYAVLLTLMQAAATKTRTSQPLTGSLLSVLNELLNDLTDGKPAPLSEQGDSIHVIACAEAGNLEPLLSLLRRTPADSIAVTTLVQSMSAQVFADVIEALQPVHAALILAHMADVTTLHQQQPQLHLSESAFECQLRLLTLRYLLHDAGSQFNRLSWLRRLLNEFAASAGVTYRFLLKSFTAALDSLRERLPLSSSLPEGLALLTSELSQQSDLDTGERGEVSETETAMTMAERFLRTGQPQDVGPRLSDLAAANPSEFAALLRRLLIATSGNAEVLIERLLIWMLPEEIAETLLPGHINQAARWADMLADMPSASMASAWTQVLDAALHGTALSGPDILAWPAERLDRMALLRQWLDQGALPWWAASNVSIDTLLAELQRQTLAMLYALFDDPEPERIVSRLHRMFYRIGAGRGLDIISRLAPWAFTHDGPLATLEADLDNDALNDLRIRAAAAAIAGTPIDLEQLARPIALSRKHSEQSEVEMRYGSMQTSTSTLSHNVDFENGLIPPQPHDRPAPQDLHLLFAWLAGAPEGAPEPTEKSYRLLADLLAHDNAALDAALREGLARPNIRQRWAEAMPDEIIARIIHRIAPAQGRFMIDLKTVMQAAWRQTAPPGMRENTGKRLWSELLAIVAEPIPPTPRTIAKQLLACLGNTTPVNRLLAQAQWLAKQGGYANLTGALQIEAAKPKQQKTPQAERRRTPATRSSTVQDGDAIYISNAGLVLCHPFLPHLFKQLGLLSVDHDGVERIIGIENASRAVHLLQYLVNEQCDAPEPELALNKLLCGMTLDTPVDQSITPSVADLAVCNSLIQAVIANWKIINNTSPTGLRETFVQRDGRLVRSNGKWTLTVSRKTVDVLVDQIPWGLAIILHSWMPNELSVTW